MDARVVAVTPAAASVVLIDLEAPGAALPAWEPGAHIDLLLAAGERQYSLIPTDAGRWRIAVLRETAGRGGSAWLHDSLGVGDTVRVRGPRNHFGFAPVTGTRYLFLAAGIGITPIAAMVASARSAGVEFSVHYAGRTRGAMALLDQVPEAELHVSDEGTRMDLPAIISALDPATAIYCCGPAHFIEAVEAAAGDHPLHVERFEAKELGAPVYAEAFEVELALSGETLTVPPDRSILEVVEEAGVFVLSSCHEGTCGTCETQVLEGEVEHRDSILTPSEQAENRVMYICVSRAACPRLVLEL
ncbi:oxidoreductase [Lacisediminihabitans sp. G11-30]|uniref:Oxidoreductase n=1 Tax=Lacisediminihabitans changchengi TaxID=2787634 RepID=A0A934SNS4_9MICO|nr:oxidoreductase [Lacisediminihabitans changchengi]